MTKEINKLKENDKVFGMISNQGIISMLNGTVDIEKLLKEEAIARGVDHKGNWIGFDKAKELWNSLYFCKATDRFVTIPK